MDDFQNSPSPSHRILVASIGAGGVGLTLTAASDVLFAELAWTPMANTQAEDRVHRLGQESPVSVTILLAARTMDALVHTVVTGKRAVVGAAVDGDARAMLVAAKGPPGERPPPLFSSPAPAVMTQHEGDAWGTSDDDDGASAGGEETVAKLLDAALLRGDDGILG